jgi:WD40 repeat protein
MRMAMSGDDRTLAVVGEDAGQWVLLDLETETVRTIDMSPWSVGFVALSADAKRIATSGWHSEKVKLWDGLSGKLIKAWDVPMSARVFFAPDNRELIIAHGIEFTFRDLTSMEVSRHLPRDIGLYPGYVVFTPDRKLMALEMTPGVIHLQEVASGRIVAKLEDPYGDLSTWMQFTPDGTQLIVAARYAGAIHRWDLRAIRAGLKTMNLDWDWPEFPAPPAAENFSRQQPLRVQVVGAESAALRQAAATNGVVAKP